MPQPQNYGMLRKSCASNLLTQRIISIDLVIGSPNNIFQENGDEISQLNATEGSTSEWTLMYGKICKIAKNM